MRPAHLRTRNEKGASTLEFAMSTFFWVPLLIGLCVLGFNLVEADRVAEISRDAGHMYAYGTDFSQSANQALAQRLAAGYELSATGNSVFIIIVIKMIGSNYSNVSVNLTIGQTPNTTNSPNLGCGVIAQRIYFGNSNMYSS